MKVSDFLSAADVTIHAALADKTKLLDELARRAAAAVDLDPVLVLAELEKREELGSTGMGGGVAIPHARFHQLRAPFGMLVRLKKPIAFEAVDGKPVDTIAFHRWSAEASLVLLDLARNGLDRCTRVVRSGFVACSHTASRSFSLSATERPWM